MKANEHLLRQIPGGSSDLDNYRTAALQLDFAATQHEPDYSRFKGLNEEEREKAYAREVFNENIRLKHYIDNGFCFPSTSANTLSSILSIELPSERSGESIDETIATNDVTEGTESEDSRLIIDDNHADVPNSSNEKIIDDFEAQNDDFNKETTENDCSEDHQDGRETPQSSVEFNYCFNANYDPSSEGTVFDSVKESINEVATNYTLGFNNSQNNQSVGTTTVEVAMDSENECFILDSEMNPVALPSQFMCNVCGKQFDKKSSLRKHQESHNERLTCDQCSKTFSIRDNLRRHKETHTEKLKCRVCKAGPFSCVFALNRHSQIHSNNRYECHCGSSFNRLDNLKKHQKKLNHN
ncbi:zinc finger protein 708-like protein [Leptotrombidium deliense]|uniref:Zinc finger protein 708-like protein n=1 Tax=Leptotrombidium deliense TaxID=299467 RepID=A0A443RXA1_9ACAR|nr:zinc finger protein 708-like protein [Leptotrombidium deliense]